MRYLVIVAFLATASVSSDVSAQTSEQIARLKSKFNEKELASLQEESPAELAFWDFYSQKGFVVYKIDDTKGSSDLTTVDFSGDIASINPLELGLEPKETEVQTYLLGASGHGIMILSKKKILAKMGR